MRGTVIFGYFVSALTALLCWEGINFLKNKLLSNNVEKLKFIDKIANEEFGKCLSAHIFKLNKLYGYIIWKEGFHTVCFFETDIKKLLKMKNEERKQFVLKKCIENGWAE